MGAVKELKIFRDENEEPGPEESDMRIMDFNNPPKAKRQWQSGLFWVDFHLEDNGNWKKAIVSWPHVCQSVAIPLPPNCETEADALKYLREQLLEGLKEENGVYGP